MNNHMTKITSEKWYPQGFNACTNYIYHAVHSGIVDMYNTVGYGYTQFVTIFNKDYVEYWYLEEDLNRIGKIFLEKIKDDSYLPSLIAQDEAIIVKHKKIWKEIKETNIESLSKEELIALYQKAWEVYHLTISISHILESASHALEPEIKKGLEKATGIKQSEKKFSQLFNQVMEPKRPSYTQEEHDALLSIAKEVITENNKEKFLQVKKVEELSDELQEKIKKHAKEFFFIGMNYQYVDGETPNGVLERIQKELQLHEDIDAVIKEEHQKYDTNNKQRKEIFTTYTFDKQTKKYIDLALEGLHWQDDRKKHMMYGAYHLNLILKEVSKKYNINVEYLKRYMPYEITKENLESFNKEEAKQRVKCFGIHNYRKDNDIETYIFYEDDVKKLEQAIHNHKEENELKGTSASLGHATGPVYICKNKEDVNNFPEGGILVASMTRPEFVPAMKKAAAIVTDEGGITCHAAIVSRELKKPCVIGTKKATKIFKNEDMVEVDAHNGIIRRK